MQTYRRKLFFLALTLLFHSASNWAHPGAKESLERLSAAISSKPKSPLPLLARAHLLTEEGAYPAALEDIRRVEAIGHPLDAAAELGNLFYHMKNYGAAQGALSRYLGAHPQHSQSLRLRALCWVKLGVPEAALQDFLAYLERAPQIGPSDYLMPAQLLAASGPESVIKALELLDRGLNSIGPNPQLQRYAVELELLLGNTQGAQSRWQTQAVSMKNSPEWSLRMAELYLRGDDTRQAMVLLDQASSRLDELRVTPARKQLAQRIENVRAEPGQYQPN